MNAVPTPRRLTRRSRYAAAVLGLLVLTSACERPFVDPVPPGLQVLEPDLSIVFTDATTTLRVEASSFRDVVAVRLDDRPMTFVPQRNAWETPLQLAVGLNRFVLTAEDAGGVVGRDTLFAVRAPFQWRLGPALPEPRGGHTATLLADGSLLIAGGTARAGGSALPDAFLLPSGAAGFVRLPDGLNDARTGHTATLLDDGCVLITGGSRTDDPNTVDDLVETVERYDPETRRFEILSFGGQPIRRALHTAVLRSPAVLDLYGGRGDIRYEPEPRLGTRRDLRSFRLTGDSLIALNTLFSAPFLEALAGHSETPLTAPGEAGIFLVAGSFFDDGFTDDVGFTLDFTQPPRIILRETPSLPASRTRHAAAQLQRGFVALFGGRQATPERTLDAIDLYVSVPNRFFRFPDGPPSLKRYGHTATKLPSQRILVTGGFSSSGNSLAASEYFDSDLLNPLDVLFPTYEH